MPARAGQVPSVDLNGELYYSFSAFGSTHFHGCDQPRAELQVQFSRSLPTHTYTSGCVGPQYKYEVGNLCWVPCCIIARIIRHAALRLEIDDSARVHGLAVAELVAAKQSIVQPGVLCSVVYDRCECACQCVNAPSTPVLKHNTNNTARGRARCFRHRAYT